jgi:hypothetical protein
LSAQRPADTAFFWYLAYFRGFKSGHLNPAKVVHEIQALEGIGKPSQLKSPSPFNGKWLRGLWHKHYLEDGPRAMAINLKKGIGEYGLPLFKQRMQEAQDAGEERWKTSNHSWMMRCRVIGYD